MLDKFKELKKQILSIEEDINKAIDNDEKVFFMGCDYNAFELKGLIRHLVAFIKELEK